MLFHRLTGTTDRLGVDRNTLEKPALSPATHASAAEQPGRGHRLTFSPSTEGRRSAPGSLFRNHCAIPVAGSTDELMHEIAAATGDPDLFADGRVHLH
ncbi:hypothetical protein OPAG_06558 [Rhodococcus opacus PD630]|nr:hypothetical protein Pd630_LPD00296 [Rhodococcus opacus PD630]EHI42222.1 hypothetical protein OPAG_06558 [Rhodococcus opacus PD630]